MNCVVSDQALFALLQEDCPWGDLTTDILGIGAQSAQLVLSTRAAMTVCCSEEALRLFELVGAHGEIKIASGQTVDAGTELLVVSGSVEALHQSYKVAQSLMEASSGIASAAAAMVCALRQAGFDTPVACTRKHFPGTKAFAVKAIQAGGATMHRLGLSETILLFPEHQMFLSASPSETVRSIRARLPEKKIVVEVKDQADARRWAESGVDVLQLDKFSPDGFRQCVAGLRALTENRCPIFSAAGGIHVGNALEYAKAGADLLVSSAPYFAPPADVQVTFIPNAN